MCVYGKLGQPFQIHYKRALGIFCDDSELNKIAASSAGICRLNFLMRRTSEHAQATLLGKLETSARETLRACISEHTLRSRAYTLTSVEQALTRCTEDAKHWVMLLSCCQLRPSNLIQEYHKRFRQLILEDKGIARRKMSLQVPREQRNAHVSVDIRLPYPRDSSRSAALHNWCINGSWCLCESCQHLIPVDLTEAKLSGKTLPRAKRFQRTYCFNERVYAPVQPEDVLEELAMVPREFLSVLSPLEIDLGPETRAQPNPGYRQRLTFIRFIWNEQLVIDNIRAIADALSRRQLHAACHFLMQATDSLYYQCVEEHRSFVHRSPQATFRQRRRRLQLIEWEGLECCPWPHLFWRLDQTCTHERITDARRVRPPTLEDMYRPRSESNWEYDEDAD